jgi:hypothetical protein
MDGTTDLGKATISNGKATITTSSLAEGTHSISAIYSGDASFATVTSSVVNVAVEDFTLGVPTGSSNSQTISAGATAKYTLSVLLSGGSTAPSDVTFSVAGLPAGATATFNPTKIASGSAAGTVGLNISVPASQSASNQTCFGARFAVALSLVFLPFLLRRRPGVRFYTWLLTLLMGLSCLFVASGCGGGSGNGGSSGPTPQTYTLTVTGASGQLAHTTTLNLTVE